MPAQSVWSEEAALARLEAWNEQIGRVRRRIEKIFGIWKRSYGLRRMRWLGLAKAALQVRLTAVAYNLRRSIVILRADPLMSVFQISGAHSCPVAGRQFGSRLLRKAGDGAERTTVDHALMRGLVTAGP